MARSVAFDRDQIVRRARTLFWRVGFEGASVPELEAVTGIGRSSLYNTFTSKRGLFDAAVQSYLDEVVRPRLRTLQGTPTDPDALDAYLSGLRDAFLTLDSLPATSGCLLVNAAGSPIADDPAVAEVIAGYRAELLDAITRGVAARLRDEPHAVIASLADTVTGLVVSAYALARVDAAGAAGTIDTARALLAAR